ncbi:coiled-coil domain-containing protein 134-like [Uloborus diversus]|uniref:coiled-coil domain-containing protein 134-like n=1 Tax=Uloborus diversus TaxID=327109 RepID=UPI002409EA46|nr:coiled-coil domain-containing protein 134-like [Uloborus diversus]
MKLQYFFTVLFFAWSYCINSETTVQDSNAGQRNLNLLKNEELFKASFYETRLQQLDVVQSILRFQDYGKQYKIIHKALEKIFEVMQLAKVIVEASDYIPGSNFPSNISVVEALSQVIENTALYGELQLKLPDITDRIMEKNTQWLILIKWSIGFSNSSGLLDDKTTQMIDLLCQEMNLIERSVHFHNPYRKYVKVSQPDKIPQKQTKKKLNLKKGPRLSKRSYSEL